MLCDNTLILVLRFLTAYQESVTGKKGGSMDSPVSAPVFYFNHNHNSVSKKS